VKAGEPVVLNYFAVGDSAIRTNPLYGRGCSSAMVHAHILGEVMSATADPRARAIAFDKQSRKQLRPFWDALMKQDLGAIRRARNEQDPTYKPRFKARLIKSFAEDAIAPATRSDLDVFRAIMRGFHMLALPTAWLAKPSIVWRVLVTWMTPKAKKLYPPKLGPNRNEMLQALGLKTA
jgi:flavin-dependent dehydrogenase